MRFPWTWYTGSAGWMCRIVVESLLGLRLEVDRLHLAPCLPAHWGVLAIHDRYRETVYRSVLAQVRVAAAQVQTNGDSARPIGSRR
jgi:cellobiose phosphorylase